MQRLVLDIQQGEFGAPITLADQPDLQDPAGFFSGGDSACWVAEAGGELVGTVALIDCGRGDAGSSPRLAALRKMFVRADWRGRDKGVADALLDELLNHARAAGFGIVMLDTIRLFEAAARFYLRRGFAEIGREDLPPHFPMMAAAERFFRLEL